MLDGKGSSDFFDQLTLCTYSQDISGCNPSSGGYYNAMKDFLIQGDTGAMELYAGFRTARMRHHVLRGRRADIL